MTSKPEDSLSRAMRELRDAERIANELAQMVDSLPKDKVSKSGAVTWAGMSFAVGVLVMGLLSMVW